MIRKQILENAIRTVCQDRKDRYGEVENNFKLIADLWSAYLGAAVSAVDVAMMMGMLKMARIKTGKYTQDNFVDLAGYAACGAECMPEPLQKSKLQQEALLEEKAVAIPPPEAKSRQRKPVDVAKIRALHNAGWSAAKIADELGCAVPTVYRHLERLRAEMKRVKKPKKEESET